MNLFFTILLTLYEYNFYIWTIYNQTYMHILTTLLTQLVILLKIQRDFRIHTQGVGAWMYCTHIVTYTYTYEQGTRNTFDLVAPARNLLSSKLRRLLARAVNIIIMHTMTVQCKRDDEANAVYIIYSAMIIMYYSDPAYAPTPMPPRRYLGGYGEERRATSISIYIYI